MSNLYQFFIRDRYNFRNSRYSEESGGFNFSQCPKPPTPVNPKEEEKTNIEKLLKAADVKSCSTNNEVVQGSMVVVTPYGGGGAKFRVDKESTIGCEALIAASKKYNDTIQAVTCMLNKSQNVVRESVNNIQTIQYKAGRDAKINCKKLKIRQGMEVTLISSINFDKEEISQIANKCKDVVSTITKDVMSTETGTGTAAKGGKTIKEEISNINNINFDEKVTEALNDVKIERNNRQEVIFDAGRDLYLTSEEECEISQDMVVKAYASNVVSNVVNSSLETLIESITELDEEITNKSKSEGVPDQPSILDDFSNFVKSLSGPMIIIAIVIIIAIIFVGPMLLKTVLGGDE
jgi:hypothetical protein